MSFAHSVQTNLETTEIARYVMVEAAYVHKEPNGWKRHEKITLNFSISRHLGCTGKVGFATQGLLRQLRDKSEKEVFQAMKLHGRAAFVDGSVLRHGCRLGVALGKGFLCTVRASILTTAFHWTMDDTKISSRNQMVWEHVEGAQWRCVSHPHVSFKVLNVNVRSVFEQQTIADADADDADADAVADADNSSSLESGSGGWQEISLD